MVYRVLHSKLPFVLTVVGELHSLTDWHVSEASEEAELDDFYRTKEHNLEMVEHELHQNE